jgi:hypothetical protein
MAGEPEEEAVLVPLSGDGLMTLAEFVERGRDAIMDMPESFVECTGVDPDEPRSLDLWLEDFANLMHNS